MIRRVPKEESGISDAVEMTVNCVYGDLNKGYTDKVRECKVMASWETGAVSFIFRDGKKKGCLSVRTDELTELMAEALKATHEKEQEQ